MSNVYLTFSGAAYDETTRTIVENAPRFGVDRVVVCDDAWLLRATDFQQQHAWLWETQPRYYLDGWINTPVRFGFGCCSWKAFVIRHVLSKLGPDDVVLYTDADTWPIADLNSIFTFAREHGILLWEEQGCDNIVWTKRDCFEAMGCDTPECHYRHMACGRFQVFAQAQISHIVLDDWNHFATQRWCQLWDKSVRSIDYPQFRRHSMEQSVLSNLSYLYDIPLHRTPDQNGGALPGVVGHVEMDWDLYPQLFVQKYCVGNRDDLSGSRFANIGSL